MVEDVRLSPLDPHDFDAEENDHWKYHRGENLLDDAQEPNTNTLTGA